MSWMDGYRALSITRDERILTITMNLPDTLNAVNHEMHEEFARVFQDAAHDTDSDVVILTGAGRAFSSGGDLSWLKRQASGETESFLRQTAAMRDIVYGILDCPKPVIARVNGDAMGFGASVALLCDVIVAVDTARLADPHVLIGLVAGDGGALIWPQLVGFAKARHYLLTGDPIDAIEAERIGLITFAKPQAEFDAFVAKYAARLARGAQTAIRYTKAATNLPLRQLFNSVFETASAYELITLQTEDFKEGVAAFLENRRPDFTGR